MKLDGLCIQFLFLKIIQSFKINSSINWLFTAIGQTITNLVVFYILTLPVLFCFSFSNYYLFGLKVSQSSTLFSSMMSVYRSISGLNTTSTYYQEMPITFVIFQVALITFYFFIMLPITVALLLDSFHNTVMELGSITDEADE